MAALIALRLRAVAERAHIAPAARAVARRIEEIEDALGVTVPLDLSHPECGNEPMSGHLLGEHRRRLATQ